MDQFGEKKNSNTSNSSMLMMMMNKNRDNNNNNMPLSFTTGNQRVTGAEININPQDYSNSGNDGNNNNSKNFYTTHENSTNNNTTNLSSAKMRGKIMAHPLFPRLLTAYANCQKVGAPPEMVARLEEEFNYNLNNISRSSTTTSGGCSSDNQPDPALDQFMEAYCEMLIKYEEELTKPFKEAMLFLSRVECQLKALTVSSTSDSPVSVLIEFLKKKKNGKLPKEARQQLLEWWSRHYKWPYPSVRGSKTGSGRKYRAGFETDKQLVYKPEKTALEAIGGHAIRGDGCCSPSSLLHGQYHLQSFLYGYNPLILS
ncbi:hypothetical protein G4B88_018641 [Cannabis sativa]|uniref:Uncharacterized protein n=1 Tax=Cannabis sativa TaxID=3483 RepID=A0A7J6HHQ1_CANSA|nr:hypothetical protein G4B88_018641 [Cannabis sativa]